MAVHWARFGPYHLARLEAAQTRLQAHGVSLIAIESAAADAVYDWNAPDTTALDEKHVICPGSVYQDVRRHTMFYRTWRLLQALEPDVMVISGYAGIEAQAMLAWCKLTGTGAVLMTESKADDAKRRRTIEAIKGFLVRRFDAALCGGTLHRAYLLRLGFPADRIFLGYDVVDNDFFMAASAAARRQRQETALPLNSPYFLASARHIPRKNLDGLIKAYAQYRDRLQRDAPGQSPCRLVLLGDGPENTQLRKLAGEIAPDGVDWPGFQQVEALPAYYAGAAIFFHPALQEQWGLVVNEAMASGIPVAVSDRCGCAPDLVRPGVNGWLFDPTDIEAMADIMFDATLGRYDLRQLGHAAQAHISNYGPERFAAGLFAAARVASKRVDALAHATP